MLICFQNTCTPDNTPETVSEPVSDHKMTSEALDKYDVIKRRSKFSARQKVFLVIVCFVFSAAFTAFAAFAFTMFEANKLEEEKNYFERNEHHKNIKEEHQDDDWEEYDDEDFDMDDEYDFD